MFRFKLRLIIIFILGYNLCFGQIIINEGSNKNYLTLLDEEGDYEDWIEIFNAGSEDVMLGGYFLTDEPLGGDMHQISSA